MNNMTNASFWQYIVPYVVWPMAAVIFGVVFVVIFRKKISAMLSKAHKIGLSGIETAHSQPQEAKESKSSIEELMRTFDSAVLREEEKFINEDLERRGLSNNKDVIDVLVRHLAATRLELYYERINVQIWGSQISILKYLNSTRQGQPVEKLRPFYDNMAKLYPDNFAHDSFERYLNFLTSWNLIVQRDGLYYVSMLGKEFLSYLVRTGQPELRRF